MGSSLDPKSVTPRRRSAYPAPFGEPLAGREKRALGDPLGLTQFGVNLVTLAQGAWSSQRHWHHEEDEFIFVLEGEVTLVTDQGEQILKPGFAAGFPAGKADGHHLINRGEKPVLYIEVGTRAANEVAEYSDIDMVARKESGRFVFTRKNGEPYPSLHSRRSQKRRFWRRSHSIASRCHRLSGRIAGISRPARTMRARPSRRTARGRGDGSRSRGSAAAILGGATASTRFPIFAPSITPSGPGATPGGACLVT